MHTYVYIHTYVYPYIRVCVCVCVCVFMCVCRKRENKHYLHLIRTIAHRILLLTHFAALSLFAGRFLLSSCILLLLTLGPLTKRHKEGCEAFTHVPLGGTHRVSKET